MNKRALAAVALLSEADAAKVFNMGTTRFKARCAARPSPPLPFLTITHESQHACGHDK